MHWRPPTHVEDPRSETCGRLPNFKLFAVLLPSLRQNAPAHETESEVKLASGDALIPLPFANGCASCTSPG